MDNSTSVQTILKGTKDAMENFLNSETNTPYSAFELDILAHEEVDKPMKADITPVSRQIKV